MSDDGRDWYPARDNFLVPTRPLAVLVRAKMRAALAKRRPDLVLPKAAWRKPWVIHSQPGATAPRPCCAIWHATSFEWRSPKVASSTSMTTVSPSATSIAHRALAQTSLSGHESMRRFLNTCCRRAGQGPLLRALASLPARSCCARPSALGARSLGAPGQKQEAVSRRYGERLFRSIAVSEPRAARAARLATSTMCEALPKQVRGP